jgi:hypothetical protein
MTGTLALKRPSSLLEAVRLEALDRYVTPQRAIAAFVEEIRDAGGLCSDLIDDATLADRALALLEKLPRGRAER